MDPEQTVTGKSILRIDGPPKVRGEAKYLLPNIKFPISCMRTS